VFRGEVRDQVQLDPDRLGLYGVGVEEVAEAARQATGVRGAGVIDGPNQRITVRAEGQAVARRARRRSCGAGRVVLRLTDLGRVVEAPATRFGEEAWTAFAGS
jgi:Cu/Ag efflux pump CusA